MMGFFFAVYTDRKHIPGRDTRMSMAHTMGKGSVPREGAGQEPQEADGSRSAILGRHAEEPGLKP